MFRDALWDPGIWLFITQDRRWVKGVPLFSRQLFSLNSKLMALTLLLRSWQIVTKEVQDD